MKRSPFRLPVAVAVHVDALINLMAYANSREDGMWPSQSEVAAYDGVYGSASRTLRLILREELKNYIPGAVGVRVAREVMGTLAEQAPADILDLVRATQEAIDAFHEAAATTDSIC